MATIGNLLIKIGADINGLVDNLNKAERRLKQTSARFQSAGREMATSISLPMALAGGAALKAFGDFQKLEQGLTAVMGSADAAREEMKKLQKVAENPGIGFEQAIQGSARLQAVGLTADEARETITQFGNAVARSGGGAAELDGVTTALGQIAAKGKVFAEEINQINERVFEIRPAMQAAFGTSNTKELEAMGISAEEFISKVTTELAKLDRVQGGFSNSLENLGIAAKTALAQIGESIAGAFNIQEFVDRMSEKLQQAADWWDTLSDKTQKFILISAAVVAAIGPVLLIIGKLIALHASLKGTLALVLKSFKDTFTKANLITSLKVAAIIAVVALLAAAAHYVVKNWDAIKGFFSNLWADVYNGFIRFLNAHLKALDWFVDKVSFGQVKTALADSFGFKEMEKEARPAFMSMSEWWGTVKSDIKRATDAIGIFRTETEAVAAATEQVKDTVKDIADATGGGKKSPTVAPAISFGNQTLPGSLASDRESPGLKRMADFADKMAQKMRDFKEQAISYVTEAGQVFSDLFGSAVGKIVDIGMQAFMALDQVIAQSFANRQATIDAYYENEKRRIEGSRMSEEQKQAAMQKLDEETDKKRRKLARQQAIREKVLAMVQGAINVASAIIKALTAGPVAGPILAGVIGAMGAIQLGMIAGQQIPALAQGGLAYGPQMAMVGDNPNSRVDPEVIAPLSKLMNIMGARQLVEVRGVISGRDILLIQERASQDRLRTRGY